MTYDNVSKSDVITWAGAFESNGNDGMKLMVAIIQQIADHRNWNNAAELLKATERHSDKVHPYFKRFLRLALGKQVSLKSKTTQHVSGYYFGLKGKDALQLSNHWTLLVDHADNGGHFSDKAFHKRIAEIINPPSEEKSFDYKASAKRIAAKIAEEGIGLEAYINSLREAHKASSPVIAPVTPPKPDAASDVIDIDRPKVAPEKPARAPRKPRAAKAS